MNSHVLYWRWRFARFFRRFLPSPEHLPGPVVIDSKGIERIHITGMRCGDVILARTLNTIYHIRIEDPLTLSVSVWSGRTFFQESQEVKLAGALKSTGGTAIYVGNILRGHPMEFNLSKGRIATTTPVAGIAILGMVHFAESDTDAMH